MKKTDIERLNNCKILSVGNTVEFTDVLGKRVTGKIVHFALRDNVVFPVMAQEGCSGFSTNHGQLIVVDGDRKNE